MRNFGLYGFITMVIVAAACVMLAAESHPAMIVLLLGGFGLLAFRFNAIIDRGRTRRGKAPDFTMQFANLARSRPEIGPSWSSPSSSLSPCAPSGSWSLGARRDESPGRADPALGYLQ